MNLQYCNGCSLVVIMAQKFCQFIGATTADNIGRKGGTPSRRLLWILQIPNKIPGLEHVGYNSL